MGDFKTPDVMIGGTLVSIPYGLSVGPGGVLQTDPNALPVSQPAGATGTIGPSSAARAQQANETYRGVASPLIGVDLTGASPSAVASFVNQSYVRANQIGYAGGAVGQPTVLSNGMIVDSITGNPIGVGPTYASLPTGTAFIPAASNPYAQVAQNLALFGATAPGVGATLTPAQIENIKNYGASSPSNLFQSNQFLALQGYGAIVPTENQKLQYASDYEYGRKVNALPDLQSQLQFIARNDDPRATLQYLSRYGSEAAISDVDIGKQFQSRPAFQPLTTYGDVATQKLFQENLASGKYPFALDALTSALETQRAGSTGRANLYYENELSRANQLNIELGSASHYLLNQGWRPYAGNPYMAAADTALELQKGYSTKGPIGPLSGTTPLPLVGGAPGGIQDVQWARAVAYDKNLPFTFTGSFQPALNLISERRGQIYPGIAATGPFGDYARITGAVYKPGISYAENGQIRVEPTALSPAGTGVTFIPAPGMVAPSGQGSVGGATVQVAASGPQQIGNTGVFVTPLGSVNLGTSIPSPTVEATGPTTSILPLSFLTGELGLGIAADLGKSYLSGNIQGSDAFKFAKSLYALSQPATITPEQYQSNLNAYNVAKGTYETNLAGYQTALGAYQAGGSTDAAQYASLQSRYADILSQESALGKQYVNLESERQILQTTPQGPLEKAGVAYENLNKLLAPYTTDPLGIGRSIERANTAGEIQNPYLQEGAGFVSSAFQSPVDIALFYGAGEGYGIAKNVVSKGVVRAAISDIGVASTLGRAASTPLAADIGKIVETGGGLYLLGSSVVSAESKPTEQSKGEAYGKLAAGGIGFAGGAASAPSVAPINPFAGRRFFGTTPIELPSGKIVLSGERSYGPLEIFRQDASAYLNSFNLPAEQRAAYRGLPEYFRQVRFIEPAPGMTTTSKGVGFSEPNIAGAATIGPQRAPAIRSALGESGTVLKGSIVVESQKSALPGSELSRPAHDIDVIASDEAKLVSNLQKRGETPAGLDIKAFESGYPEIPGIFTRATSKEGIQTISLGTRLLGEPISTTSGVKLPYSDEVLVAGRDYTGVLSQEKLNVQFARKSQAVMQDLMPASAKVGNVEARAIDERFRLPKDYYDLQFIARDLQQVEGVRTGKPQNSEFLKTLENTPVDLGPDVAPEFSGAKTLGEIRQIYETQIRAGINPPSPTTVIQPQTPGIIPSAASATSTLSPATVASALSSLTSGSAKSSVSTKRESGSSSTSSPSAPSSPSGSPSSPSISDIVWTTPTSLPGFAPGPSRISTPSPPVGTPYVGSPPLYVPPYGPSTPSIPGSPVSPPPYMPSTPGSPPSKPTLPIIPIIPKLPPGLYPDIGGGGAAGFGKRGRRKYLEVLPIGLDISTFGMGTPRKVNKPRKQKIKRGKKK